MALNHTGHDGRRARIGRQTSLNSKQAGRRRTQKLLEALEGRSMFSAVAWTGSGDGSNWSDPANWSGNAVPGSADDVTINVAQNIQISGARSAHSLNNAGSLSLMSNATLNIATTASSSSNITMSGGTINGGAWTFTNPNGGFTFNTNGLNTINGATISGDLMLSATNAHVKLDNATTFTNAHLSGDSSSIGFAPGSTLNGTILMEGAGSQGRYIESNGSAGTLTIGATGAIKSVAGFGGSVNIGSSFWFGGGMSLVNNGLISIETTGKTMSLSPVMTNAGTLRAINGSTLNITSSTWSSSGTISAAGGSTISLSNTWTNTGAFNINNSTLNLGGTFTTAGVNVAGFTRVGGQVNLTGTMNNASNTMTFNSTTGMWNLAGGTINGGAISYANGASLAMGTQGGTLKDVTVNGDLSFNADNAHASIAGTTTFNTARLIGNGTSIGFAPGYTLNSTVQFEGAGTLGRYVESNGTGTLTIGATGVLKTAVGFGGSVNIGSSFWFGGGMSLVNNGLIRADVAGKTMNISATSFTNNGNLQAVGGTLNVSSTTWSNAASGTIAATSSTVAFSGTWSNPVVLSLSNSPTSLGGTFSTASFNFAGFTRSGVGAIDITGTLNNTGSTLALGGSFGTWNLKGGTISGGQVSSIGASTLALTASGGTLNNVTVVDDITAGGLNEHVRILGATRFNAMHLAGDGTGASFAPGYTLSDSILFESAGALGRYVEVEGSAGTLTIGPSGSIKTAAGFGGVGYVGQAFWSGQQMTLVNQGLISSEVSGRAINVTSVGGATVSGTMRAQNGGALNVDTAGSVTVSASGVANVSRFRADALSIAGQASAVANGTANGASVVKTLTIFGDASFDLNDNDLIVRNTPRATIEDYVRTAYNFGGWDGPRGIFSSAALSNPSGNTTLGMLSGAEYLDNNGAPSFDNQPVNAGDTLVKYTYYGDVDFNGQVDVSDFNLVDFGFTNHQTGWATGDADWSGGSTDVSDYNLIGFAFSTQTAIL